MEAVLLTAALALLIVGSLVVLARTWPRSSRLTGFRIRDHETPARPVREDDEPPRWRIPPRDGDDGGGSPRSDPDDR